MNKQQIAIGLLYTLSENIPYFLVQNRVEVGPLNGMLEFPGGKVELDESAIDAVRREMREEQKLDLDSWSFFQEYIYSYPDRKLRLTFFISEVYFKDERFVKLESLKGKMLYGNGQVLDDLTVYFDKF